MSDLLSGRITKRIRGFYLSIECVVRHSLHVNEESVRRVYDERIPGGAKFISKDYMPERGAYLFVFEHRSFSAILEGSLIPVYQISSSFEDRVHDWQRRLDGIINETIEVRVKHNLPFFAGHSFELQNSFDSFIENLEKDMEKEMEK